MEYLNGEEIKKAIRDYIEKAPYDYAVMINGDWGSGKSYLIKKELIPEIESIKLPPSFTSESNYKVINISLYGLEDIRSLSNLITTSIFYNSEMWNTKIGSTLKKVGSVAGTGLRILSDISGKSISASNEDLKDVFMETAQNCIDINKYVFIFDDLERSTLPLSEIFGFLSNLIEGNSVKVIVVANEKEIKDNLSSNDYFQKYIGLASISDKLQLPEVVTSKTDLNNIIKAISGNRTKTETKSLIEDEALKLQIDKIFPPDENYRKFKEKIIGQTITYRPALEPIIPLIMESIFDSMGYNHKKSNYDLTEISKPICDIFNSQKFYNLRILQMIVIYLGRIFPFTLEIVNSTFGKKDIYVLNQIIYGISNIAIKYSIGVSYEDITTSKSESKLFSDDSNENKLNFLFAVEYFYYGIFNESNISTAIKIISERLWQNKSNPNNPLNILSHFYTINERDAKSVLTDLLEEFNKNKYDVTEYPSILRILLDLQGADIIEKEKVSLAVEKMCNNVKGIDLHSYSYEKDYLPQLANMRDLYREYLQKIIIASKSNENSSVKELIITSLQNNKLCSPQLKLIYKDVNFKRNDQSSYFLLADLRIVISLLKISPANEINEFRNIIISFYYNVSDFPKSEQKIREFNKLLSNAIEEKIFYDKIALLQVEWLKSNLDSVLSKFPTNQ